MSHFSPAVALLWSILSTLLLVFLVWHLWKFDRFACLGWGPSRGMTGTGGFKRLMIYSYICSVPLLLFYSVTFVAIKYYEGYLVMSPPGTPPGSQQVVPLPFEFWGDSPKHWILPLYIAFSIAWALEIVSHLEELNFWLFLMSPTAPKNWFLSWYFMTWVLGSVAALVGLPVTAIVTRHDTCKSEAWIFFVGSCGSFIITIASLKVLWQFPRFIALLRKQGADPETVVRLSTYSQLNNVRVLFRFLFVLPLLTLAIDGIRPGHRHEVNGSGFATDTLVMIAGVGCVVQSALTLLVFFPRSIVQENGFTLLPRASISDASQLRIRKEDDYYGSRGDEPYPYPMVEIGMRRVGSMSALGGNSVYSRKTQEWLANQETDGHGPALIHATGFGTRARVRSFDLGRGSRVINDRGAPPNSTPVALRYNHRDVTEFEGDPNMDEMRGGDDQNTSLPTYSTTERNIGTPLSLPTSQYPLHPTTAGVIPNQQKSLRSRPSLPTVVEPATSRATSPDLPTSATPFDLTTNPQINVAAGRGFAGTSEMSQQLRPSRDVDESHVLGSPFEWDYIDLERASNRHDVLIPRERRPGAGSRNGLADVPFDEMRARGTRYSELAARQAAERDEIHPYLKKFRSPLDLYDPVN